MLLRVLSVRVNPDCPSKPLRVRAVRVRVQTGGAAEARGATARAQLKGARARVA